MDVAAREALSVETTPFGSVGVVHSGTDLAAWWIWKDDEDVEPSFAVIDHEDLLFVIRGSMRLEQEDQDSRILRAGEVYVIPAGMPFRGYRWPRNGEPCLFLAVAPARSTFTRL